MEYMYIMCIVPLHVHVHVRTCMLSVSNGSGTCAECLILYILHAFHVLLLFTFMAYMCHGIFMYTTLHMYVNDAGNKLVCKQDGRNVIRLWLYGTQLLVRNEITGSRLHCVSLQPVLSSCCLENMLVMAFFLCGGGKWGMVGVVGYGYIVVSLSVHLVMYLQRQFVFEHVEC